MPFTRPMTDAHRDLNLDTDIAVVGMAGRFTGARDLGEFWANLKGGVESLQRFTEAELVAAGADPEDLANPNHVPVGGLMPDMAMFDAKFFGFSPREASILDPQHRHFLEVSWQALENAAHVPSQFKGSIGVFAGSGHNAYMPYNLLTNPKLVRQVGLFLIRHTGNDKDFLTTRVSYLFNLKGPSVNVQTACSTSLVAIHSGVQSLLNRECDMALAGGVTIEMPHGQGYVYHESEVLSPDGRCRAFDANSKGTVFGSGCGVVVLRRLQDALNDGDFIHAVIKGSAINNDGALKVGYLAPSVDGQAKAIAEAMALADVSADTVSYVEAHGTGTPVGDPIEVAALTQVYREQTDKVGFCRIGSVKPNIGHLDTAAGVASFIKVALAMQHRQLPASLFFESNNPACNFDSSPFVVNQTLCAWEPPAGVPRRAGVSSLGVGGTNAHVVMQEAPLRAPSGPSRKQQLFVQSAKSLGSLDIGSVRLAALLQHEAAAPNTLADVAHTLRVGREALRMRRVVAAGGAAEAAQALLDKDTARVFTETASDDPRRVVFMFPGGGSQFPTMGADLYRDEPVYRDALDASLAIVQAKLGRDLRPLLFPAPEQMTQAGHDLAMPSNALPALVAVQVAMARLLMSWGVEPAVMIGHSLGEYTAAHLAGVFTLEQTLTLVALRGKLFESLPPGGMLSVPLSEQDVATYLAPPLDLAVVNAPSLTVVSGPNEAIDALQAQLARDEIDAVRVRVSAPAHSAMLDPILPAFEAFLRTLKLQAPTRPFVSNLSGGLIKAEEAIDPMYWVRHLRHTVRFADGLGSLLVDEACVLVEVGPGRALSSLTKQHALRKATQPVIPSMRNHDEPQVNDQAQALTALGRLWAAGVQVPWAKLQGDEKRLRVQLPGYAFDHQRYWVEPGQGTRAQAPHERALFKRKDVADWLYEPRWAVEPIAAVPSDAATLPAKRRVLLFADRHGLVDALARALRDRGDEVTVVRDGAAFKRIDPLTYALDLSSADDMTRLVEDLGAEDKVPTHIVHAGSITGGEAWGDTQSGVRALRGKGFDSLFGLAQAMGRDDWSAPIKLLVLSDHAQRVADEAPLAVGKALLLGPVSVIPREMPNVRTAWMDVALPTKSQPEAAVRRLQGVMALIMAELDGAMSESMLAVRAGQRWVQRQVPLPLAHARPVALVTSDASSTATPPWREQGVYLITGGLGGIGLALAATLAKQVCAKLVLVGRTALPPRDQWALLLARSDTDAGVAKRLRQVTELERLGAQVMVAAVDVTDADALARVLGQVQARFGALHGVLHTAGVLDDGVMQLKDAASIDRVLAPKVNGTLALAEALRRTQADTPPDFVVLFSSISAFAGLAGQVDYAAANAFLDAYAQARHQRDRTHWVAVNWSQWQDVGMAAELAHRLGLDERFEGIDQARVIGHPLVERSVFESATERVYEARLSRQTHWLLEEHRVREGQALIPGTGYLELARAAFADVRAAMPPSAVELRDVVFLAPFVVLPDAARDVRVHMRSESPSLEGPFVFTITGRPVQEADGQGWTEHVRGTIAAVSPSAPAKRLAMDAVRHRCVARSQEGAKTPINLHFGPRWNNVERIDYGQLEAVITLQLGAAFTDDLRVYPLHPALMDLATAGAQALIDGFDEVRDFFVPATYDRLVMHAPLTPRLLSHVRLRESVTPASEFAVYDVTITDGDGAVLVDIEGFTMIRVRDKAVLSRSLEAASVAAAKPRAIANTILAVGVRDGIHSSEGAQVLTRVLAWGQGARVVVSPQDLEALLAQLQGPATPSAQDASPAAATSDNPNARAPSTATEKLIAHMWSEMLGHASVSAQDNFFDLGGHSLLAVQVINKLKKRTGKALPLTALLEAPTVEALAAMIEPPGEAPGGEAAQPAARGEGAMSVPTAKALGVARAGVVNRTLIPIRQGQGHPPLFLVHDGNGETLLYRTLAHKLDKRHAVYGLQPAMLADSTFADTTISSMARAHLEQLRGVQPEGPYLLAGLCAGGVVAAEMALQLQQAGQRAAFLGLMDSADVAAQESNYEQRQRMARFKATFDDGSGAPLLVRVLRAMPRMASKVVGYVRWTILRKLEIKRNQASVEALRQRDADSTVVSAMQLSFIKMYQVAHYSHQPQGQVLDGHVVVYRAQRGTGAPEDVAFAEKYTDDALGWRPRFKRPVEVKEVPGGHTSLLQAPHVDSMAAQLQADIDHALRQCQVEPSAPAPAAASVASAVPNTPAHGHAPGPASASVANPKPEVTV
jgi:acyl transferase domain-containing protein/thioesterase domain-containing protein/acyl carrier protein